ncbi:MAG: hypothetical protein ACRDJI_00775 [Actinomycetota bacterium]
MQDPGSRLVVALMLAGIALVARRVGIRNVTWVLGATLELLMLVAARAALHAVAATLRLLRSTLGSRS